MLAPEASLPCKGGAYASVMGFQYRVNTPYVSSEPVSISRIGEHKYPAFYPLFYQ